MRLAILLASCAIGWASSAVAMSEAQMKARTVEVAHRYLETWSSDDPAAVTGVPYVYGDTVRFFGRAYTQDELIAEKRRAVRRWPVRRYGHRPGTIRVSCNVRALKCAVRSTIDYRVANPERGTSARGSARFDLGVGFDGPRPRILYEDGSRGVSGRD